MRLCTALQVLCISLVVWAAGALPASSATRHVVLLYDERLELPGLAALDAELTSTLTSNSSDPIEIYREEMDLSRFSSDTYRTLLRDFLRAKYANKKIDVAVAVIGPALDFLLDNGDTIFPGTPIVFCAVDRKELGDRSLPPHVRGILLKREFAPTLEIALRIHPQTTGVVFVAGTSEFDKRLLDQARSEFHVYRNRLVFSYLTDLPLPQILAELAQLPPQTIVLFTTFFQDSAGEAFVTHDVAQRISAAANSPVYGFLDQYLGRGIVGGSLYSSSAQGSEAAKLVLRVLAGTEPSGPTMLEVQTNKVLFDWRQMQRWGISESSLPAGSEIRFRDPTVWDHYRAQILAICAALLVQAALICWLIFEHRRRHLAEIQSRNAMIELTYLNRSAAAGQLSASIAHEVLQPLTGITTRASAALRWLRAETPNLEKAGAALEQIVAAGHRASDIITSVRAMFRKDTSERLPVDMNGIIRMVLVIVRIDLWKNGVELQTQLDERDPVVEGDKVQLQQVVLNLVMNAIEAMQSARPRVLTVKSEQSKPDMVRVSIEDTGTGIDPSSLNQVFNPLFTTKEGGMGMGLSICQSIIENHDGRIWVSAGVTKGSIFQFELPTKSNKDKVDTMAA
jgi:signal transduction histidine kinase